MPKVVSIKKLKKKERTQKIARERRKSVHRSGVSVPAAERERIKLLHIQGWNYSQLAEYFGRNWRTIKDIATEKDVRDHVESIRREWMGCLGPVMRAAILDAINGNTELGYRMLCDSGIIPKPQAQNVSLSWQQYPGETDEEAKKRIGQAWIEGAFERAKYFELPMPEVDLPVIEVKSKEKERG